MLILLWTWAGSTFPEGDQSLPSGHRSALTQSLLPLLPLLARPALRPVGAGLGLHLAADCFPRAMTGYATVKLPLAGSIGGWSYLWLGANAVGCTALGALLLRTALPAWLPRATVLAGAFLLAAAYLLDRKRSLLAGLLYFAVAWTVLLPVAGERAG